MYFWSFGGFAKKNRIVGPFWPTAVLEALQAAATPVARVKIMSEREAIVH